MTGTLKGYDQLMNLVLDNVKEVMRGELPPPPCLSSYELLSFRPQTKKETNPIGRSA